ncbi:MAG: efflux RND transporter permease subunit [Planctomycetota bacterium]|nr:efflux RND transporter permease subunit [Planctomycetota bacterium]
MIRAIVRAAVRNPVAVNLGALGLCSLGVLAYTAMPREVIPILSRQSVSVMTFYPGASAEDVERLVTLPIEDQLAGLDDMEEMLSTSQEGFSTITLSTSRSTDIARFLDDVRARVQSGDLELPADAEEPAARELRTELPVIAVYVYGWADEDALRHLAEEHQRLLEDIEGVSSVRITGVRHPRLWIEVDPLALERYGLTLAALGRAVEGRSRDLPLGSLSTDHGEFLMRVDSEVVRAADLESMPVIAGPDGTWLPLSSVARVRDAFERSVTRARFNGHPAAQLHVRKKVDGDLIDIAAVIRDHVDENAGQLPEGVYLGVNSDLSVYVENRLRVMRDSGLVGLLLVSLSLLSFLSARVAFWTALGIPVAFLGGILLAGTVGVTMNMVTMMALIVVLGMIVDDAIVVGENIFRLMEEGMDPEQAAVEGVGQVGKPVLATILTSIVAFLPVLMMGGTSGELMRPVPLVVSFCLVISLVEALTLLPSHLAHWGAARGAGEDGSASGEERKERWYEPLRRAYVSVLERALRWRYVTLAAACGVASLVGSFAISWLPFVLYEDFESKIFHVNLRMAPETSLVESERVAVSIERLLREGLPAGEVESVNVIAGVLARDANSWELGQNLAQLWVELSEGEGRTLTTREIVRLVRELVRDVSHPVESTEVDLPQAIGSGKGLDLWVRGPDLGELRMVSGELAELLGTYAGVHEVTENVDTGKLELVVQVTDRARALGLDEAQLASQLRASFEGARHGRVRRGRDDVELIVKAPEELRADPMALDSVRVSLPGGGRVPLASVAEVRPVHGLTRITRKDRERAMNVVADVETSRSSVSDITSRIVGDFERIAERHPGYELLVKGDQKETEESMEDLTRAAFVALALIFVILGALFRSVLQPFVIMFIIPFGGVGVVVGHALMGRPLSMLSMIGLLALTGVVVNDSLILVEFVNEARRAGAGLIEALLEAGRTRFRPILLTSVTTMLGLTPLTFFVTGQARFLQPMAISLFFGLAAATGLVLVIVPCAYAVLEDLQAFARRPRQVIGRLFFDEPAGAGGGVG